MAYIIYIIYIIRLIKKIIFDAEEKVRMVWKGENGMKRKNGIERTNLKKKNH